jgi:hypothetical protein
MLVERNLQEPGKAGEQAGANREAMKIKEEMRMEVN